MSITPPWEKGNASKPKTGKNAKDENSESFQRLQHRTAENLTDKQVYQREVFVAEYCKDFHGTRAATRAGFSARSAAKKASELLREPFVQQKLRDFIEEAEEESIVTRKDILAGLVREANAEGRGSVHIARVNAWGKLAKILGMELHRTENTHRVSGVMQVPMPQSMEEWEGYAKQDQQSLKERVRE